MVSADVVPVFLALAAVCLVPLGYLLLHVTRGIAVSDGDDQGRARRMSSR